MATLIFKFTFVNNASPAVVLTSTELTGATAPTVNISTTAIADGTVASAVSGGALTYDSYTKSWGYRLASADLATYLYVGMATTTYATASPASVHALGMVVPDVLPSTLATPAQVTTALNTYDAPTKAELDAGFAGLSIPTAAAISDAVWDEATSGHVTAGSTGKALGDAGASGDPWAAPIRTLTQAAASVVAAVSGSGITIHRGDTLTATLTGLGSMAARTKLWFTVKTSLALGDTSSTIQITESGGLVYLNGAATTTTNGSIVVSGTDLIITIKAAATTALLVGDYVYDVQMATATGVQTLTSGTAAVTADVTRDLV